MKIAYVVTRADAVGGASIHVRDLAQAMRQRGHEATVLVGGAGPVTEQFSAAGIPFRSVESLRRPVSPRLDLRALREVEGALAELRPDVVSAHTAKAGWIGRAAGARLGLPVVHTPHGWPIGDRISTVSGAVFTLAERLAARWTAAVICVCEYERELALEKRVARAESLFVVHNGIREVGAELRADAARSPVRLCAVARLEEPKDHATLLEALAMQRSSDWALDLVGDGPLEAAIRSQADALGIGARVHFHGYHPEPAQVLAGAQLFVLSSRWEAFPRSVLEAMRAGLPVIASRVGGIGEAVDHGVTGLLVEPGSPQAMAAAIGELASDPARRQRMGAAARRAYEDRFGLEAMVKKTEAVYDAVLARPKMKR